MQGEDFSKLYLEEHATKWRDEFFYEWPSPFESYNLPKAEALVRKGYKYLYWSQFNCHQLFHVSEDHMEELDLVNETSVAGVLLDMNARFNELKAKVAKTGEATSQSNKVQVTKQ
jgi:arylsulfatase